MLRIGYIPGSARGAVRGVRPHQRQSSERRRRHSNLRDGAPANARGLGENVAYGASVPGTHDQFMNSSGHRRNILNGTYTEVGTGIVRSGNRTWHVQVFMST
jgi:uncharacterized protein YkwD